ncbi:sensor histidine kinase [Halopseudomonas pelagia]|uniref:histidine kinase n=1 Tax=Halopseudomonas pelagia TaxID=553151 RepID=A0AA91TZS0_9GAMM|nr:ATP-binding protein [Halopseudomonas pelagia]PCC97556.1 PAS domain-containing sensor histidine kinase [Halopseudomonas pelagia]QFY57871.1 PAS domain-containing protein [Halopseudomonas pelagia]
MVLTAKHLSTVNAAPSELHTADAKPRDEAQLTAAYELFRQMSGQLSGSYALLQEQVSTLQAQLDQVHAQRHRELAEKACLASRLQNLLDLLPGGVVVLDGNGVVREANPAARELLGEPLEGQLWRDLIRDRFAPRDDDYHEVSLRSGRRVSLATRSLLGEPGQIILINDQTETRQLQSQLARHERLSALGRMVASLAHQIRTPLSTAMLYASHLHDQDLPAAQRQRFGERLSGRLKAMEHQVRDMLLFAKGDLPLEDRVSVEQLFDALQVDAGPLVEANAAACRWDNRCPQGLALKCNRDTLVGAITNLIDNAIQAGGDAARLKVCARLIEGQLSLSVVDTGCGMDAEQRAQIGEPFYTTRAQGTGLGVSVVKSVARAHGGAFYLRSKAGWGTSAELLLPVQQGIQSRALLESSI